MLVILFSCSEDESLIQNNLEEFNDDQKKIENTSILIGKVLSDRDVKKEVLSKIENVGILNSSVSLSYLLNSRSNLMKNEIEHSKNFEKKNLFKDKIINEILSDSKNYSLKIGLKTSFEFSKNNQKFSDDLIQELANQNLQIFFPFNPEYKDDDLEVTDFYMTYHPLEYKEVNNGFKFKESDPNFFNVDEMSNNFLDENPVFVIVPIDDCDIPGVLCGFDDLRPSSMPISGGGGFPVIMPPGDFPIYGGGGGTPIPPTTPGDPINGPVLLTDNYNHNNIPETDLLTTNIPRIMILGTGWTEFGATHQKLKIYRGASDGFVTQNADGTITAKGNDYIVREIRISRRNCRKKRWVGFNTEFDPDWTMSENSQSIAVFSIHHFSSSASAELKAKSGFKLENGIIKPFAEVSGEVKINVSTGSANLRANFEISRRHALATIIGPGTTGRTIESGGVNYNHKWNGRFNYYFQHYYTDLTD